MPSIPLSEKAKGKQRADSVDVLSESTPPSFELTVRFSEGFQDLILSVGEKDTGRDIKTKIRRERVEISNRRLRLIHSGRLLTDRTLLYPLIVSHQERQNRETTSNQNPDTSTCHPIQANIGLWLHCSVGPVIGVGEDEDETPQTSQIRPLRGFDRFQEAGFSEEDIASIRRQFHSDSSNLLSEVDLGEDDGEERARVLEEQWIDSIDTTGSAALSQSSSASMLEGLLLGFFFPIIPFFFFRELHPPAFWDNGRQAERLSSVVFTKRMQMAIVIGFILNLTFGLWRYLLSSSSS